MSKVLYVDDNDDNVYMLKMRLELLGDFEVITAEDGEKGCEMVCTERPDIVLLDLEVPGISGWEAAKRIKSNPGTCDIPVLALSAHPGEREKALAAGCDEFDTKPVHPDLIAIRFHCAFCLEGAAAQSCFPREIRVKHQIGCGSGQLPSSPLLDPLSKHLRSGQ
jgi:CheY-like chemotaxis protein